MRLPLDAKFHADTLDEDITLREYFKRLLTTLWHEEDGFSGKRPFGNSGWQWELASDLMKADIIEPSLNKYGEIKDMPSDFDKSIMEAIARL